MKTYSLIYYWYLFLACAAMLLQVFLHEISLISDFGLYTAVSPYSDIGVFAQKIFSAMFFLSLYNVFICGLSGVIFLIKKYKIWLGVMCVSSALVFVFI